MLKIGGIVRGYGCLALFVLMAGANLALIYYTKKYNKTLSVNSTNLFRRELCTQTLILIGFELSYLIRFAWDAYLVNSTFNKNNMFNFWLAFDIVNYAAGLTYAALLLFHRKNFSIKNYEVEP